MHSLIKKVIGRVSKLRTEQTLPIPKQIQSQSLWQDTGEMFYLLDTLKLTYKSDVGLVTLEQLSLESIQQVIENLLETEDSLRISPLINCSNQACINVSVCGVTWQELEGKRRVKAVKDAAFLQLKPAKVVESRALFQHCELVCGDGVTPLPEQGKKYGVFKYFNLSFEQFFKQLEHCNQGLPHNLTRSIPISRHNFDCVFTDNQLIYLP